MFCDLSKSWARFAKSYQLEKLRYYWCELVHHKVDIRIENWAPCRADSIKDPSRGFVADDDYMNLVDIEGC